MAVELGINHAFTNGADDNTTIALEVLDARPVTIDDVREFSNTNIEPQFSTEDLDTLILQQKILSTYHWTMCKLFRRCRRTRWQCRAISEQSATAEGATSCFIQWPDETELEDTVIDTSMSNAVDVDLSQFESEIYPYFVPEDARAKLLTMYMANKQEEEEKKSP